MFKVLYKSVDAKTQQPIYFMIQVKGKVAIWFSLNEEQFNVFSKTIQVIK